MDWNNQLAKELHKQVIRKFPKRNVISTSVDEIWSCDLLQLDKFAEKNDNFKYILVCVDLFSRYTWLRPLKNKTQKATKNAFLDIFSKGYRPTKAIYTDQGSEFLNKSLRALLNENNIHIYSTFGENKSMIAERNIRSLKLILYRYFTATNDTKWVGVLPELETRFNKRIHKKLKMTPTDARKGENNYFVFKRNLKKLKNKKPQNNVHFKIGDEVRISKTRGIFHKSYLPSWSEEVFKVVKVLSTAPTTYLIADLKSTPISGSFYSEELQAVSQKIFWYKIIKTEVRNKKKRYFVHWRGYPENQNSWITDKDIKNTAQAIIGPTLNKTSAKSSKKGQNIEGEKAPLITPIRKSKRLENKRK